ncbi:Lrp/AsnC family transcriptional regulator [Candidatus Woesearchaeota archaeon]|nr:Lrp/AsnC family transcriptional regulator [Candidatus Woesearchaeota archaeon]
MRANLDVKDRKLLYQLDLNARQPNSMLAKNVGVSKQVCGLRLKRFEKEKLITTFYPVIDIARLGFTNHKNFLRLHNIDQNKEMELINWLKHHRNVVWLSSCDGMFDLAFGTWAQDMVFLDTTLTELNQKFGQYIAERQIATIIRGEYFVRDYLIGKKASGHRKESFFGSTPNPIKMDENDWEILRLLALDCRENVTQLARKVKLSADAVTQRIRKLEISGVIKHYNFVPNE